MKNNQIYKAQLNTKSSVESIREYFLLIFLVALFLLPVSAFPQMNYITMGNKAYEKKQYLPAIEYYTKALNKSGDGKAERNQLIYNLAECYRLTNNPKKAGNYYERLIKNKYAADRPEIIFLYASMLTAQGLYAEALPYFEQYISLKPGDLLALNGKASCEMSLRDTAISKKWLVKNLSELNTIDDDFAASCGDAKSTTVVFSTNRKGTTGKEKDNWTGGTFSDLFIATKTNDGKWADVKTIDDKERVNTIANEGTPGFDNQYRTMYFTRCEKFDNSEHFCQIMEADRSGTTWTKPVVVFSDSLGNAGHPTLTTNGLTMIFSSNRPGGFGGKDLWKVTRQSERKPFGEPVNLGPSVNTPGDEMFPYLHNDTILYFASNGLKGYGGLDIYSFSYGNSIGNIHHLPKPVNSQEDDFALTFEKGRESGFFSSRRKGGKGGDDIYYFEKIAPKLSIEGLITEETEKTPLGNLAFRLTDGSSDSVTLLTDVSGRFTISDGKIKPSTTYTLLFSKEGYFSKSERVVTGKPVNDTVYLVSLSLLQIPEKPIVLPDIYYDLDKWDLLPQYQDSLMVLVNILNDNPKISIELASHTDSRASDDYNDALSQKRAESVVSFLTEKGIDPSRLTAKGYGERVPRVLQNTIVKAGYTFPAGTKLTEAFILKIKDPDQREAAYQLNRRTEFSVIRKNIR